MGPVAVGSVVFLIAFFALVFYLVNTKRNLAAAQNALAAARTESKVLNTASKATPFVITLAEALPSRTVGFCKVFLKSDGAETALVVSTAKFDGATTGTELLAELGVTAAEDALIYGFTW